MKPEQRVAARVVQKYRLTVPIDVSGLARELAEVEEDVLPVNCDAVVLTSSPTRIRPLIILNSNSPSTRRRFTLAHEMGHLLIPWHMGTFACHTGWGIRLGSELYVAMEAESNRFASELLLPSTWLAEVVRSGMSPAQILKFVRSTANVSTAAATLAICQALSPGHLFAITNEFGFVQMSSASPGSTVNSPIKGQLLEVGTYSARCTLYENVAGGMGQTVHWWRYTGVTRTVLCITDARTSNEILKAIVESAVFTAEQARSVMQSINGAIGSANSSRKPSTAAELLSILYEAFTARPNLTHVISHPDFDTFLSKRAFEIVARRPKS